MPGAVPARRMFLICPTFNKARYYFIYLFHPKRRLRRDPRVPHRAKIAVLVARVWVASPIDLIPDFVLVIGPLDDVVVVALALRHTARQVPRDVLLARGRANPGSSSASSVRSSGDTTHFLSLFAWTLCSL